MEDLNKNIAALIILELAAFLVPIILKANEQYLGFWAVSVFTVNIVGIVLLIRHKPKYYALSILALLLIMLTPIVCVFLALSSIQC